jgi:hypothetical protein
MRASRTAVLATLLGVLSSLNGARAEVRVVSGPTPIPGGSASSPGDITVINERLAFALAVRSSVPYGLPRGALVDLASVSGGRIGRDRVEFADFIPNNWSAWPNTYQHVEILERGPRVARIRAVRDFGKVTITTLYSLESGSDEIAIRTTMTNEGQESLPGLLSGLTLWPSGGFLFPVPGLAGIKEGKADGALAPRVVAYDADWTVTLHAPYLDHIGWNSRDLFQLHTLAPHASRTFEGWLQVGTSGDLAPVVAAELKRARLASGKVHGTVATGAQPLAQPVVVVEKNGVPYAWALGHGGRYALGLPAGDYALYATGRGYSRSTATTVHVAANTDLERDFTDLRPPGRVEFAISNARRGTPLDARISISEGDRPVVEFLGRKTFFTELAPRGYAAVSIAPGHYRFSVSSGAGFLAKDEEVPVDVEPGAVVQSKVQVTRLFDPPVLGWYSADLHHHADQAEAVTPPADLARSQLAAGLDLLFVSDHDSTVNHEALRAIAAQRAVPFLAGIEISPSWGHFNAYPIAPGAKLAIDPSTANVDAILAEARREGAAVVQVNHPFNPYGYFTSLDAGVAPGGFNPGFDLIEINAAGPDDDPKVMAKAWTFWNEGRRYYLSGGSDTHDVWNQQSGRVRTFAHVEGPLTAMSFVNALKAGCAYVSHGPLIFPQQPCGQIRIRAGRPSVLAFALGSVAGLKRAQLMGDGRVLETRDLPKAPLHGHVEFALHDAGGTRWYALVVEDTAGAKAYTDPYWVSADDGDATAAPKR